MAAPVAGFGIALAMAATFPLPTLPLAGVCAAAGIAYDLGLKRGALSWLPFWVGFACLPLTAGAAVGELSARVAVAAPPLALGAGAQHPARQRAARHRGRPPERLGGAGGAARTPSGHAASAWGWRALAGVAAVGRGAGAGAARRRSWPSGRCPWSRSSLLLVLHPLPRPFPLLAPAVGVLAAVWLLALP